MPDVKQLQVAAHLEHSRIPGFCAYLWGWRRTSALGFGALGWRGSFVPAFMDQSGVGVANLHVHQRAWEAATEDRKASSNRKNLAPKQQQKYDAWCLTCNPRLVFSKSKQELITDSARVKPDCISIQLHLSDEPDKLQVTTCSGNTYRLVLLRGQHDGNEAALQACGACWNASLSNAFLMIFFEKNIIMLFLKVHQWF